MILNFLRLQKENKITSRVKKKKESIVKKTEYKLNVGQCKVIHWEINIKNIMNKIQVLKSVYIPR